MNLVDTSGWIEFLYDGANADFFAPHIEDTAQLLVPVICLYEVFKKVNQSGDEARALQAVGQMKQGHVEPVSEDIALRAALLSLRTGTKIGITCAHQGFSPASLPQSTG
jgi:predicted nucleic acid-binding protein